MITPEEPKPAEIIGVQKESHDTKTFTVRYLDRKLQKRFFFMPGKFMMLSVFGFGEIPLSISSSPYRTDSMQFTVVNVGNVTSAMHRLKKGDKVGLRGPFGNGFPMQRFRKKNLLFVSGGCGLAPLRSAILAVQEKRAEFGEVSVLFGCRTPLDVLFGSDMKQWQSQGFAVHSTVDRPGKGWKGNVGVVTKLFSKVDLPVESTAVLMCGPPVMISFALAELRKKGFRDSMMFASLERMMQCGVGYCAHCNIGKSYACIDGPVFSADQLEKMPVEED